MKTYVSLIGWGAYSQGRFTQELGSREESRQSINLLQVRVIYLGLPAFQEQLRSEHVLVQTDNVTSKTYIKTGRRKISINAQ